MYSFRKTCQGGKNLLKCGKDERSEIVDTLYFVCTLAVCLFKIGFVIGIFASIIGALLILRIGPLFFLDVVENTPWLCRLYQIACIASGCSLILMAITDLKQPLPVYGRVFLFIFGLCGLAVGIYLPYLVKIIKEKIS